MPRVREVDPVPDASSPDSSGGTEAAEVGRRANSRRSWLIAGAVVIAIPVVVVGVAAAASGDQIPEGTTVAGVEIGGLSAEQATAVLTDQVAPRVNEPLVLTAGAESTKALPAKAGVSLDVDATVGAAQDSGGGPIATIGRLFGGARPVDPVMAIDDVRLQRTADTVTSKLDQKLRDGGVRFKGERAIAVPPVNGVQVDPDDAAAALVAGAVAAERDVVVVSTSTTSEIDGAEVARAMTEIGEPAVSGPVTVKVAGPGTSSTESVTVPVSRFTPYLKVQPSNGDLTLVVDGKGLRKELAQDLGDLESPARDATFRISGGKPVVVASRTGQTLAPQDLAQAFGSAVQQEGPRVATVRLTTSQPEVTTAQARELGVVEQMATFTQDFPYAPYRFQNIGQAAERVNGTLLLPGDVFSMNDTVLERTPENGYTEGFVIKDGRLTEDLGGGVSTITTAVWHSAFFAGLERVEQRAHSFYISRYQAGLEATVSWGSLDLKFKNDSGNGVFITAERGRNFVTVTMWGTKKYDIDDESSPRTNVKPFGKIYDASDTCTPQPGVKGFTIVVTRVFSQNGAEVKREPLRTTYRPAANVICRPAPKPSATPKPTASPKPSATPKPTSG